MFERFTQPARRAVVLAQEEARQQGAETIGAEHVLFGVLSDTAGAPAVVLQRWQVDASRVAGAGGALDPDALSSLGIDLEEVRRRAEEAFGPGALDEATSARWGRGRRITPGHLPFTAEAKAALGESVKAAVRTSARGIGTTELFVGLLATPERTVPRLLQRFGVTEPTDDLARAVLVERDQAA